MNLSLRNIAMVLYKHIRLYIFLVLLFASAHCYNETRRTTNSSVRSVIIQRIMKKVANITLTSLYNAPLEKKQAILSKIETKLRSSARSMGLGANRYVKYIMDEFKAKAFDKKKATQDVPKPDNHYDVRANNKKKHSAVRRTVIDPATKKQLIMDISKKVQYLARRLLKDSTSADKKKDVMEKIKKKIIDTANKKHKEIHFQHDELKAYSSLIEKGVEISMRQLVPDDARRMEADDENVDVEEIETQTEIEAVEKKSTEDNSTVELEPVLSLNTDFGFSIDEIKKYENLIANALNDTPGHDPHCDTIVEETCASIQSFNKIACGDGKTTPIENLCNGVIDCWNQIDEVNCTEQAMENVKKATTVMFEIETSLNRQCFVASSLSDNLITTQNQVLRDVLQTQMDFLKKNFATPLKKTEQKVFDDIYVKKTVSDVSMILSTLSYALDGTLCAHRPGVQRSIEGRKFNDLELDEILGETPKPEWSPASCICEKQFCRFSNCDAPCKRVCWQRYSLNRWGCQAIHGGTSVSLDVICDGKLDCFDETDESNCAPDTQIAKFQAGTLYSELLDFLTTKSRSHEFIPTRNKLAEFHGLVRSLQKHTMKTQADAHIIKPIRDESFDLLVGMYDELLLISSMPVMDDIYLTLIKLNEQLVTALKRSHTGNDNIMSSEGCYCRGGLCILRRCTRNCVQSCMAQPILTKYSCSENVSVSIETICNGKDNCPNGEDEKDCKKDICRGHHLVMLRRKLQNVAAKYKETVLGDVLENWKNKVSAILVIAENAERPNHQIMVEIIGRVLHDLVTAYAAIEDYRRAHSDNTLGEFKNISKLVMESLKSCKN